MSNRDLAKAKFDRAPGEPVDDYIAPSDAQAAIDLIYDDLDVAGVGGGASVEVETSPTPPTGTDRAVGTLWVQPEGSGGVLRGVWTGAAWANVGPFPTDITYTSDPGRPEFIIRNDYAHTVDGRDTVQVWANGTQAFWLNEWGGPRVRVPESSAWDAALRLIAAAAQSGNVMEVQDSGRTRNLLTVRANGIIDAPNIRQPAVVLHGTDPVPAGTPAPALLARIAPTTARWNYFAAAAAGDASLADGWDAVIGTPPIYGPAYGWAGLGLRSAIANDTASYVLQRLTGDADSGYARLRLRVPALGNRNPRVWQTESSTGSTRHGVRINTAGKVEIVAYDGVTVLATSTTSLTTGTWVDLSIHWVMGNPGTCTVRIHTDPLSDTPTETLTANGNYLGAGGSIAGIRWGQQATNTGTNVLDIGMVAWDLTDWVSHSPPPPTNGSMWVWDGATEIPLADLGGSESPSATFGPELGTGVGLIQTVTCTPGDVYQVGGVGVTAVTLDGAALPMPMGASAGQTSFVATATSHTLTATGGTVLSVRRIDPGSVPAAGSVGGLEIRRRATNTALGGAVHRSVSTATGSTAVGNLAQASLTTGSSNTALGEMAQMSLHSGVSNTGVGRMAQYSLTSGSYNVALGYYAQYSVTTGEWNTGIGYYSQAKLTTGQGLTAVGHYAQAELTTGQQSTAFGLFAQSKATSGSYNVAMGAYSQRNLTTAGMCTAVGYYSQYSVTSGYYNSSLGYYSHHGVTTGAYNSALGHNSGRSLTTGRNNLHLGAGTGYGASQAAAVNGTVALGTDDTGAGAYSDQDNTIVLGTDKHDLVLRGPGKGIYMRSPNGTRYRVSVADGGTLTAVAA